MGIIGRRWPVVGIIFDLRPPAYCPSSSPFLCLFARSLFPAMCPSFPIFFWCVPVLKMGLFLSFPHNTVNCRKRKIRCLQDKNDIQGRCVTCIRLRKDCFYEAVDHALPPPPSSSSFGDSIQAAAGEGGPTTFRMGSSSSPSMPHQLHPAAVQNLGARSEGEEGDYPVRQNSGR